MSRYEELARDKVDRNHTLRQYSAAIFADDLPNRDAWMKWISTTPAADVEEWAKTLDQVVA